MLFVKGFLTPTNLVSFGAPESATVRSQDLVDQDKQRWRGRLVNSEFKLGIGDNNPSLCSVDARFVIQFKRKVLDLCCKFGADELSSW